MKAASIASRRDVMADNCWRIGSVEGLFATFGGLVDGLEVEGMDSDKGADERVVIRALISNC